MCRRELREWAFASECEYLAGGECIIEGEDTSVKDHDRGNAASRE